MPTQEGGRERSKIDCLPSANQPGRERGQAAGRIRCVFFFFCQECATTKVQVGGDIRNVSVGVYISEPYRRRTPGRGGAGPGDLTDHFPRYGACSAEAYLFGTPPPPVSVSRCMRHRYQQYITAGSFFSLFLFLTRFAVRRTWKQ
jgi:hypothetical protein